LAATGHGLMANWTACLTMAAADKQGALPRDIEKIVTRLEISFNKFLKRLGKEESMIILSMKTKKMT
jgi:hypothetical protein